MLFSLVAESALLGISSFACGLVPLSFTFSKGHLERLTYLGMGLLLGAALGVIIPEGIESIAESNPNGEFPTHHVALALLSGFTFMLVIEQSFGPHSHPSGSDGHHYHGLPLHNVGGVKEPSSTVEFDAELGELEREQNGVRPSGNSTQSSSARDIDGNGAFGGAAIRKKAFPLTFGLIIHGLADGLALAASSLAPDKGTNDGAGLSLVVFFALIIHKAPTALALTTSLLATSLPRPECKRHLLAFSCATPIGAIASYLLLSSFGNGESGFTGIALLISGGTFLYVATVLQDVSHSDSTGGTKPATRVLFISIGMFIPFLLGSVLGHGH